MEPITLAQAAKDAIAVQDACNLSGVTHSFIKAVQAVNAVTHGTDERNNHPIIRLYVEKLSQLAGTLLDDTFGPAYKACQRIAEGE